jgi:ArsR family transcriptional regulator
VATYSAAPLRLVDAAAARIDRTAALLGAIAHPKRLAIVAALARRELCVCELVDALGLPQPLVSHHLAALRGAGVVQDRRDAHWVYYSLAPAAVDDLRAGLGLVLGAGPLPAAAAYGAAAACAVAPD